MVASLREVQFSRRFQGGSHRRTCGRAARSTSRPSRPDIPLNLQGTNWHISSTHNRIQRVVPLGTWLQSRLMRSLKALFLVSGARTRRAPRAAAKIPTTRHRPARHRNGTPGCLAQCRPCMRRRKLLPLRSSHTRPASLACQSGPRFGMSSLAAQQMRMAGQWRLPSLSVLLVPLFCQRL